MNKKKVIRCKEKVKNEGHGKTLIAKANEGQTYLGLGTDLLGSGLLLDDLLLLGGSLSLGDNLVGRLDLLEFLGVDTLLQGGVESSLLKELDNDVRWVREGNA